MPRAAQVTGRVSKRHLARLGVGYSHPANDHEEWYDKGGDLLTQIRRGLVKSPRKYVMWMLRTIELPTQMPMVSSILFFMAIHTEVTCSAAFACTTSQI